MQSRAHLLALGAAVLAATVACGNGAGSDGKGSLLGTDNDAGPSTSSSDDEAAMGTGDDPEIELEPVGNGDADTSASGCQKIDFVFVVDNSASMASRQAALIEAVPGFFAAIEDKIDVADHHIMVVDSDGGNDKCVDACGTSWGDRYCNGFPCQESACDKALGAGIVARYGLGTEGKDCGFPAGRRFLESGDSAVGEKFACAARVGDYGDSAEFPLEAMVQAVAKLAAPGECNAGFLRHDALLVVTLITDDTPGVSGANDDSNTGDPKAWYQALVDAKDGDIDAVTVVGFVPDGSDASCGHTPRFVSFVEEFGDNGLIANVCGKDYASVFARAIKPIDTACREFEPIR